MLLTVPLVIGLVAAALLGLGAIMDDRRARAKRFEAEVAPVDAVVPLLHSINDDRCIGCEACIDVCPTEVLDLVENKVRVLRFKDCIQCEQCMFACPTEALVMYPEGTAPPPLKVPELDEHFQTGVPGPVPDRRGRRQAARQERGQPRPRRDRAHASDRARRRAAAARREIRRRRDRRLGPGRAVGGADLHRSALSCLVLEKEQLIASTIARYPKGKHFMAEPDDVD